MLVKLLRSETRARLREAGAGAWRWRKMSPIPQTPKLTISRAKRILTMREPAFDRMACSMVEGPDQKSELKVAADHRDGAPEPQRARAAAAVDRRRPSGAAERCPRPPIWGRLRTNPGGITNPGGMLMARGELRRPGVAALDFALPNDGPAFRPVREPGRRRRSRDPNRPRSHH